MSSAGRSWVGKLCLAYFSVVLGVKSAQESPEAFHFKYLYSVSSVRVQLSHRYGRMDIASAM